MQDQIESNDNEALPQPKKILDTEWCFQFFDNEPVVFAFSNEGEDASPLVLQIQSVEGQGLNFKQNGMEFKIFPREISEETKLEREKLNGNDVR